MFFEKTSKQYKKLKVLSRDHPDSFYLLCDVPCYEHRHTLPLILSSPPYLLIVLVLAQIPAVPSLPSIPCPKSLHTQ